jgi:hypothetical protein
LGGRAVGVVLAGHTLEFVEPIGDGPLRQFVEQRGERIHSLSLTVVDLGAALAHLADLGVGVVPGAGASRFIDPAATLGGLIELAER